MTEETEMFNKDFSYAVDVLHEKEEDRFSVACGPCLIWDSF